MACATLGLSAPQLPSIFLPSGVAISVNLGTVGVTCCHFTIPAARVAIPIPLPAAALATAAQAVNAAIKTALATLDQIQIPNCPSE